MEAKAGNPGADLVFSSSPELKSGS
jgi:hypothetical protein